MRALFDLVRNTIDAWIEDRAPTMAAALAFYSAFAIARWCWC